VWRVKTSEGMSGCESLSIFKSGAVLFGSACGRLCMSAYITVSARRHHNISDFKRVLFSSRSGRRRRYHLYQVVCCNNSKVVCTTFPPTTCTYAHRHAQKHTLSAHTHTQTERRPHTRTHTHPLLSKSGAALFTSFTSAFVDERLETPPSSFTNSLCIILQ